jgi:cell division protease FtsH
MQKKLQFSLWYFVFALLAIFTLHDLWVQVRSVEPVPYSEFQRMVKAGEVSEIAITDNAIQGTLKKPLEDGRQKFVTTRVDPALAKDLSQYDVKFTGVVENTLLRDILGWVLPAVIFVGIWIFAMRKFAGKQGMGGGFMNLGKSKAKVYVEADTGVSFGDVAGVDEAKDELKEVVGFLKDPKSYGRLGGRVPKGVLLVGPPGTGKTLLAKAVAGEAGVPFFSISGSEFVEMFVGVGAARVRDLFEQARAKAPAIIFIDELDAMGRARGAFGGMGGHDEKEQTLNQLLVELDGFDSSSGLVLLAATNRPEVLDPALLRAGRFDRQVLVDRPDKKGRIAILQVHMKKITRPGHRRRPGGGAHAGLLGRRPGQPVQRGGPGGHPPRRRRRDAAGFHRRHRAHRRRPREEEPGAQRTRAHRRRLPRDGPRAGGDGPARHRPGAQDQHHPAGVGALGYTIQRPTEDRFLMTRAELENKMAVLLGGRAAEQLVFGEVSTGAADDLQKVTSIARSIVMRFGMHEELGNVAYDSDKTNFLGQAAPQPRSAVIPRRPPVRSTARCARSSPRPSSGAAPSWPNGGPSSKTPPATCWPAKPSTRPT